MIQCKDCQSYIPKPLNSCPNCQKEAPLSHKKILVGKFLGAASLSITLMACYGMGPEGNAYVKPDDSSSRVCEENGGIDAYCRDKNKNLEKYCKLDGNDPKESADMTDEECEKALKETKALSKKSKT